MSLWHCPTCNTLNPNGDYHCPTCRTPMQFATITPAKGDAMIPSSESRVTLEHRELIAAYNALARALTDLRGGHSAVTDVCDEALAALVIAQAKAAAKIIQQADQITALSAQLKELQDRDRAISHQLERRADGMDPLTQELRAKVEALSAERDEWRAKALAGGDVVPK